MKHDRMLHYSLILLLCSFAFWGCPKKAEMTASPEAQNGGTATATNVQPGGSESNGTAGTIQEREGGPEHAASSATGLKPIYFDFDKSFIRDESRRVLMDNAAWLQANPKVKVRIEGFCDERGTKEYNQALGQRRAATAKKFLADMGISAGRISLISYGKEKQVCSENTENCWQKNRKDEFVAVNN